MRLTSFRRSGIALAGLAAAALTLSACGGQPRRNRLG